MWCGVDAAHAAKISVRLSSKFANLFYSEMNYAILKKSQALYKQSLNEKLIRVIFLL